MDCADDGTRLAVQRLSRAQEQPASARAIPSQRTERLPDARAELCGRLGDEIDQAAWFAGILMTSMPFWNLTPWTTLGN